MQKQLILVVVGLTLISGCTTTGSTEVLGSLGAITGAVISKNPWKGAVIGGVVGATGGSIMDQRQNQQTSPRTDCRKRQVVKMNNGRVISDTVEEICEGKKNTSDYWFQFKGRISL